MSYKAGFFGSSSSWCWTVKLQKLMWGSELLLLWENLCNIIVLQFLGLPPRIYGVWYIISPQCLLVLYDFSCRRSSLVGSSIFHWWLFFSFLWCFCAHGKSWAQGVSTLPFLLLIVQAKCVADINFYISYPMSHPSGILVDSLFKK